MAQPTVFDLHVSATVVEALGLLLTAWRIYFRLRIHRFWWEDAWATAMLFVGIISITSCCIYLLEDGLTSAVASWIYIISFTCIVMSARMSVLFSIIRINHGCPLFRTLTYACVAYVTACWAILILGKVWYCASRPLDNSKPPLSRVCCVVEPKVSIFEFSVGCIAVSFLVVLPLRMLWRVKLPKRQRMMILSIFASSVVLALGALFHTVGQVRENLVISVAGMHAEVALSIIVCNLLVVVTYTYRFLLHKNDDPTGTLTSDDDDFTTPVLTRTTALALTTVDLDLSLSSSVDQQLDTHSDTII